MRKCDRDMLCVKGIFRLKCRVDGHRIKLEEQCRFADDHPKIKEIFAPSICDNCDNCAGCGIDEICHFEMCCPNSPRRVTGSMEYGSDCYPRDEMLK